MIAYVDSSVVLRVVLGQARSLREWKAIRRGVASALLWVECLRTLDRLRVRSSLSDTDLALRRAAIYRIRDSLEIIAVNDTVLARASQPFPTPLGTLDAIHLASALLWQEHTRTPLVMATHDEALATAARSCGMVVAGVSA